MSMLQRLKERKLVQWTVAYLAGAWLALEVFDLLRENLDWSPGFFPVLLGVLALGLVVTLVLAWYHGEQGRQRASGPELLIIGGILLVAALLVPIVFGSGSPGIGQEAAAPASSETAESPFERLPGIAVMPFESLSGAPEDASFTAGIRRELVGELARIEGLRVVSQTRGYEDTPARQIGAELGVRYLLTGSIQRAAESVRINVQLIETEQGGVLWSDSYPRQLSAENLFEVQGTIVSTVADVLEVELSSGERARLARDRTDSYEAYDLYLRASWLDADQPGSREFTERSIEMLKRAVDLDAAFVDAWAMLSSLHSFMYGYHGDETPARRQRARETAERALDIDRTNALAQLAMADYYQRVEKDWDQSMEWLERSAGTLQGAAWYNSSRAIVERRSGSWEAALASWQRAVALAPGMSGFAHELGNTHQWLHHFDEAQRWFAVWDSLDTGEPHLLDHVVALELMRDGALTPHTERAIGPGSWFQLRLELGEWTEALEALESSEGPTLDFNRGIALRNLGREAEAEEAFTRAVEALEDRTAEASDDPRAWSILGMAYAALGRSGEARDAGELAVQIGSVEDYDALEGTSFLFRLAVTYTWLGDHDRAIDTLDRLLGVPSPWTSARLENHAWFAELHDDPRFQAVMDEHRGRVFLR